MKTRKQIEQEQRKPVGFYKLCRFQKSIRKAPGRIEVQVWGQSATGELCFAGVHWLSAITARHAWRIADSWQRWRRWYDRLPWNRNQYYPAKNSLSVASIGIHPVCEPGQTTWFKLAS